MEKLTALFVLGLLATPGLCQMNPAMMALMSGMSRGGAGGLNPMALGMAGGEMGNMQDMMMMQALAGGSGGSGGGGGIDPTMLMLMGGGAGGAPSDSMMQNMLLMNMFRNNNNNNNNNNQGGGSGRGAAGAAQSYPASIANLLTGPVGATTDITPEQQTSLWGVLSMTGNTQRIIDALSSPTDRDQLEKTGHTGLNNPLATMPMCPRLNQCPWPICGDQAENYFTPESFYICPGCQRCPMDTSQRRLMNMMRMGRNTPGGNAAGGQNMAQTMLMMRAMGQGGGGAGGAGGNMDPAMMMALMNMQNQQQQQQQASQPTQSTVVIPPSSQNAPSPAPQPPKPQTIPGPRPPPEFIAAMRAMSAQLKAQTPGAAPASGPEPTAAAA